MVIQNYMRVIISGVGQMDLSPSNNNDLLKSKQMFKMCSWSIFDLKNLCKSNSVEIGI